MRRTVLILMALSLTLMASTSFAKQRGDDDSHRRPQVAQQAAIQHNYHADNRGYERYDGRHQHPGKRAVRVSRHEKTRHHHVADYRHHRQPTCNSYKADRYDYRTTIVIPAPPLPRVVVHFPW